MRPSTSRRMNDKSSVEMDPDASTSLAISLYGVSSGTTLRMCRRTNEISNVVTPSEGSPLGAKAFTVALLAASNRRL